MSTPITPVVDAFRAKLHRQGLPTTTLKLMITGWVIGVLFVTWFVVDNPWILAGIFAYEVLP